MRTTRHGQASDRSPLGNCSPRPGASSLRRRRRLQSAGTPPPTPRPPCFAERPPHASFTQRLPIVESGGSHQPPRTTISPTAKRAPASGATWYSRHCAPRSPSATNASSSRLRDRSQARAFGRRGTTCGAPRSRRSRQSVGCHAMRRATTAHATFRRFGVHLVAAYRPGRNGCLRSRVAHGVRGAACARPGSEAWWAPV